ncbi:MAG: cache domain-containing protein [Melioribacteraceae bacterium]|nr:cache domain-containing protein [Melioribacteraceae bacterium]
MKKYNGISLIKILLPTFITLGLLITALFLIVIPRFENIILDRKREMIKELTISTISMIEKWYSLEKEGKISKEDAQKNAKEFVRNSRYGTDLKDYFWITDMQPKMIVHPYRIELEGKSLKKFEDSKGKYLFVEMKNIVEKYNEGFVDYMWQWKDDSTKIVPKLSYVKKFEPWDWIIGTGIYIEDVKYEISELERNIISISTIITLLSSLLLSYIAYQNYKSEKLRKIAEDELKESREKYKMLVEASNEGMIMILENGQTFINKITYDILGFNEETDKQNVIDVFKSIKESKLFDFSLMIKKKNNFNSNEKLETKLIKKDGSFVDVILDISKITVMNNEGIVITVKDVSTNKSIKEALDFTKEKFLSLTNKISIGVFRAIADNKLNLIEVNPGLINLLGYQNESFLINKSLYEFFYDSKESEKFISELFNNGVIKNIMIRLRKNSNEIITVSFSAVLVKNNIEKLNYVDGIIEDISLQKVTDEKKDRLISELLNSFSGLNQKITPFVKSISKCRYNIKINEALKIIFNSNCKTLLIEGNEYEEIGTLNELDITEKIIASNKSFDEPVYSFMNSPIIFIYTYNSVFDAIIKMKENNTHYLIVRNQENKSIGVVHLNNLFESTLINNLFFIKEIEEIKSLDSLKDYRIYLLDLLSKMVINKIDPKLITKMISLISDTIIKKIINNSILQLGNPPCKFAFITMGSEGREEQTFLTDQDNAIIFEDVESELIDNYRNYFLKLGELISNDLNYVGYNYCKGGIMAQNIKWTQPLNEWKNYFTNWITNSSPQDILDSKIFFDFRFIYGEENFVQELKSHINNLVKNYNSFLIYLSESIVKNELPDSILKLKSQIDIKLLTLPIIDFARLYGIKFGANSTNTIDRLEYLNEKKQISDNLFNKLIFAYTTLMNIKLKDQTSKNFNSLDNHINVKNLSEFDIIIIRKYFDIVNEIKDKINLDFKGTFIR